MTINENGYNKIQINSTLDMDSTGRIIKRSLMLNIREDDVKTACKLYQELKRKIEGEEKKPEKKAKNNPGEKEKQTKKEQKKNNPGICPKCDAPLVEKQGISSKNGKPYHFFSCSAWPICDFSKPFISETEKHFSCDEDLVIEER